MSIGGFALHAATPADPQEAAEEQADQYAALLMPLLGRIDLDSVYEVA